MVGLQVGVDKKTVIDWFMFIRDVCSADLLAQPILLGGPGQTVIVISWELDSRLPTDPTS